MSNISRELFYAIHEGYWLYIEYHNKNDQITKYWIAVKDLDPVAGKMLVEGMHLQTYQTADLNLTISRILSAKVIEGTYAPIQEKLVNDIKTNPEKYYSVFSNAINLKILNYLSECNKLDQTPYQTKVVLVEHLDDESLGRETLNLKEKQFEQIVKGFQKKTSSKDNSYSEIVQLGLNLLSINYSRGIYVLAYQPLKLDVKNRALKAVGDVTICSEFTIDGERQSIRQFMDPEDLYLLEDFSGNAEKIRDLITNNNPEVTVDDIPYLIEIGRNPLINLDQEYDGILKMYQAEDSSAVTVPI
ncbi:MAG: hypothetical protein IKF46_03075, partial [Erysipelotrichaceae bacterium]|nr:hypothetical protein [Erysipelotrichaceae bacterium]